jgi:hypothetical protein
MLRITFLALVLAVATIGETLRADAKLVELQTCYQGIDWPVTQAECVKGIHGSQFQQIIDLDFASNENELDFASNEDEDTKLDVDLDIYGTLWLEKADRLSIPVRLDVCHVTLEARGEGFSNFMRVPLEVCN